MLTQLLNKLVHFLFGTELGVDPQWIGYIVSMTASPARFTGGDEYRCDTPSSWRYGIKFSASANLKFS